VVFQSLRLDVIDTNRDIVSVSKATNSQGLSDGGVDLIGAPTELLDSGRRILPARTTQETVAATDIISYADFTMRKLSGKCLLWYNIYFILFHTPGLPFRKSVQSFFPYLGCFDNPS